MKMSEWKKYNLGVPLRVGLSAASPRCSRASLAAGFPLLSLTQDSLNHYFLDLQDEHNPVNPTIRQILFQTIKRADK
jgi:hypothetical protein